MSNCIETYTGKRFDLLQPLAEDVDIRDIAHALSLICRFGGHSRVFYSVAEHSVRMSRAVPPRLAYEALMHDAAEAYLVDVPRPIKKILSPAYGEAEHRVEVAIRSALFLPGNMPDEIHRWDDVMLKTEARDLGLSWWTEMIDVMPIPQIIEPWDWRKAKHEFLYRFEEVFDRE